MLSIIGGLLPLSFAVQRFVLYLRPNSHSQPSPSVTRTFLANVVVEGWSLLIEKLAAITWAAGLPAQSTESKVCLCELRSTNLAATPSLVVWRQHTDLSSAGGSNSVMTGSRVTRKEGCLVPVSGRKHPTLISCSLMLGPSPGKKLVAPHKNRA